MRNARAVSTTLSYVLTLSIATLLVTGLLIAGAEFVDDRRQEVVREELTVVGHQFAADFERTDRLVVAADSDGTDLTVGLNQSFPRRVAGVGYRVTLNNRTEVVELAATDPSVTVSVSVALGNRTAFHNGTVDGGAVWIRYDGSSGKLEVADG